jgi:hypothetical protein
MRNHETVEKSYQPEIEICYPNHFYAAYIFDQAESHQQDIGAIIEESQHMRYPVRYWWLSQAIDIQNYPDRLIVCVHHPTNDENAGMDLYNVLRKRQVSFAELNAAALDEYVFLGRCVTGAGDIRKSDGTSLFAA